MKTIRYTLLATILMLLASVAGYSQVAEIGTVTITNNGNKFTLTRSKPYNEASCYYRLVGVTAIDGIHFKETIRYNGARIIHGETYIRFPFWEGTVEVVVNEITDLSSLTVPSRYTNGDVPRKYIFEVLDENGNVIASKERTIDYSTTYSVTNAAFYQGNVTVNPDEITVTDDNYSQDYHTVPFGDFFISTRPREWLESISAELRMTLSLQAKEKDDGYQHVQILVNQTSNHDEGAGDNNPGTINYSSYMACFVHKGGSTNTTYYKYSFPVTSANDNCGNIGLAWSGLNNIVGELRQQYFNTNCRAADGRLVVAASGKLSSLNTVGIRFDASGDNKDTWYAYNTEAQIQAVDNNAPERSGSFKLDKGCDGVYNYNTTYYITIPFNEIVIVSGSPTLSTNWGENLTYIGGSGTNALNFRGTITCLEPLLLQVKTLNLNGGSIKDLAGNSFTDTNINQTSTTRCKGGDADGLFNKLSDGSYEISTVEELKLLARYVNAGNTCEGLTFRQTADLTGVGFINPIGYNKDDSGNGPFFNGHYNGGGHIISGASITMGQESHCTGLFGELRQGVIENVKLINSAISGQVKVGPIVGENYEGTVRNCFVGSDVSVGQDNVNPNSHGGVVGCLAGGIVEGCVSAARLITTGSGTAGLNFGGIVGRNTGNSQIKNCLFLGPKFEIGGGGTGAIVGYIIDGSVCTLTNNYYTTADFWGLGDDVNTVGDFESDIDNARKARVISSGDYVTITPSDDIAVYDVSGITAYGTTALSYNGNLYSGETQTVNLILSHEERAGYTFEGYSVNSGTLSGDDNPYVLTVPAENVTVSASWSEGATLDILAHEAVAEGQTRYWTTFYHPDFSYRLPAGALAFTMKSDKTLYCVGNGSIIPSGCAVVIMTDASALTDITSGSGTLTLTRTTETAVPESGNILSGNSAATAVSDVVAGSQKVYILGKKSSTFGFFQFSGSTIPSNKAYYVE